MSTYELPIERIDAALLDSLVRDGVEERRRLEYKRALPGGTDDEKKEFLADTSSFANAAGGDGSDMGAVELQAGDVPPAPAPVATSQKKKKKCKKKKHKRSAESAKKKKCKKKKHR